MTRTSPKKDPPEPAPEQLYVVYSVPDVKFVELETESGESIRYDETLGFQRFREMIHKYIHGKGKETEPIDGELDRVPLEPADQLRIHPDL